MNARAAYETMQEQLAVIFGLREAENMTKIYFEDVFNLKLGLRKVSLSVEEVSRFENDLIRLKGNEPVAYVTGRSLFYGYPYEVNKSVLIPRPETEELVHWVAEEIAVQQELKILDIGTGSGCIAISLAKLRPACDLFACDVSGDALKVAKMNAENNQVKVKFIEDDILDPHSKIDFEDYDVIVSNPPYISADEMKVMSKSTLSFEPDLALYGKEAGLIFYRIFAEKLLKAKDKNISLYLELNEFKADQIQDLFDSKIFNCVLKKDMQGKQRMLRVKRNSI